MRSFVAVALVLASCSDPKVWLLIPGADNPYQVPAAMPSTTIKSASITPTTGTTEYSINIEFANAPSTSDIVAWLTIDGANEGFLYIDKQYPAPASGTLDLTLDMIETDDGTMPDHAGGGVAPDSNHDLAVRIGDIASAGPATDLGRVTCGGGASEASGSNTNCPTYSDLAATGASCPGANACIPLGCTCPSPFNMTTGGSPGSCVPCNC